MAQQEQLDRRKRELVNQLASSRKAITRGREELKEKLQLKQLLKKLISNKPKSLFAGSAVAGLAGALFLRRPRKVKKAPQSTRIILLGWILTLLKPAAKAWIVARAKEAATHQPRTTHNTTPRV